MVGNRDCVSTRKVFIFGVRDTLARVRIPGGPSRDGGAACGFEAIVCGHQRTPGADLELDWLFVRRARVAKRRRSGTVEHCTDADVTHRENIVNVTLLGQARRRLASSRR